MSTIRRSAIRDLAWVTVLVVAAALGSPAPASAAPPTRPAFPGENGRIVFDTAMGWFNGVAPSQIYTVLPDGSDLQQLTDVDEGSAAWHPVFSPKAYRIAYVSSTEGTNHQVWIMRADGSHQRPLIDEPAWEDTGPTFTADGRRVLYSRCGAYVPPFWTCKIVSVRLDGSGRRTIIGGTWHPSDPAISPDGTMLAYASDAGGYEARIWLADADGEHRHALGPTFGVERVMWSPDGTHLVFTGYRTGSLYTIATDDTGLAEIAPGVLFGAWSPDGTRIVSTVDSGMGAAQLQTTEPDGSDPVPLVDASLWAGYSDWGVAR